jgi:hypothetical protein
MPLPPSVDPAQGITAGAAWCEHLSQETPERYLWTKDALPTVGASLLRSQQRLRNKLAEKLLIVADRRNLGRVAQPLLEARERGFTEKTPMKISEERGDGRHPLYKYIYL